jgi:predicted CxxxxCH...CXXCH cytochrome family protein
LSSIACVTPSGAPATLPSDATAPIVAALDTPTHAGILSGGDRQTLVAWVTAGTPSTRGGVHDPGFADPRSAAFHGAALRAARWAPMLDPNDPGACGRCHDGAPARPDGVTVAAPGAPSCTSCHTQPGGPLACSTCHGSGTVAYPPRDPCFFPGDAPAAGAHAAHVQPSPFRSQPLQCATCHPVPDANGTVISGVHGNGSVDVVFDPQAIPGPEASYDPATQTCAVSCHDQGGARARPAWSDTTPLACGDCHGSPPASHYPGACNRCHFEANATGTALTSTAMHMNGKVDLGDGSGKCGACHGSGDSPWPTTSAHPAHQSPTLTQPIACETCHVVPTQVIDPVHLDGTVHVTLSGALATARGSKPAWDGKTCTNVACHGANLVDPAPPPAWTDTSGAAKKCGTCHPIPPSQHTPSLSCDRGDCHGSEIQLDNNGVPQIAPSGKSLHIDGIVESNR